MIRSFSSNIAATARPSTSALRPPRLPKPVLDRVISIPKLQFNTTAPRLDFHFDTHHFVQRLEREGLNRAQAEGIMSAMAEVIDESIRNMTSNMVTKADQEKVRALPLLLYLPLKLTDAFTSPFWSVCPSSDLGSS